MNPALRSPWLRATLATLLLLGGLWVAGSLIPSETKHEVTVMEWMAENRTSFTDDLMATVTAFGSPAFTFILLGLVAVFVLVRLRSRAWFGFLLMSMLAPAVYDRWMKQLVERPRPDFSRVLEVSGYGFPSGHATSAAVVAGALVILFAGIGPSKARPYVVIAAATFALLVGGSRIYLGVHWPTDVLGGFILGLGWVAICYLTLRPALVQEPSAT